MPNLKLRKRLDDLCKAWAVTPTYGDIVIRGRNNMPAEHDAVRSGMRNDGKPPTDAEWAAWDAYRVSVQREFQRAGFRSSDHFEALFPTITATWNEEARQEVLHLRPDLRLASDAKDYAKFVAAIEADEKARAANPAPQGIACNTQAAVQPSKSQKPGTD